jgi:hypothetical protein
MGVDSTWEGALFASLSGVDSVVGGVVTGSLIVGIVFDMLERICNI